MFTDQSGVILASMAPELEAVLQSFAEYLSTQCQNATSMFRPETDTIVSAQAGLTRSLHQPEGRTHILNAEICDGSLHLADSGSTSFRWNSHPQRASRVERHSVRQHLKLTAEHST